MSENNNGVSLVGLAGVALAALMSWAKWHSIFWAIIHGVLCSWIYVIYSLIRYGVPKF